MSPAFLKEEMESALAARFGPAIGLRENPFLEVMSTGIPEVDSISGGGLPRGAITEVWGPASSGRTSLLLASLAEATARDEVCALVDATDGFDPASAAAVGIDLNQLLWVRCGWSLEHAIKATDLILQGGGFGLVALDMGDIVAKDARRIPSSYWFRFRRAIEKTPTCLLVISGEPGVRSCATLGLEMSREGERWSDAAHAAGLRVGVTDSRELAPQVISREARVLTLAGPPRLLRVAEPRAEYAAQPSHARLLSSLRIRAERQRPIRTGERQTLFEAAGLLRRPRDCL
ncbi:MAG TPA: hypothetical protein VJH03_05210 [Blastocatellia bacterium]|nr:hypothetical protein [Blastocatellia bacterium]